MNNDNNIKKIIEQGVNFIFSEQKNNGEFTSISAPQINNTDNGRVYHIIFSACLILDSLSELPQTDKIIKIKRKAVNFLLSQKNSYWTFNVWAKKSPEYKTMPYPNDLDDTACALAALYKYDSKIIDGEVLGNFTTALTTVEKKPGGPYGLWLVKPNTKEEWKKYADLAQNSNVAYFLSLLGIELSGINEFVEQAIDKQNFHSPYYTSIYPVIYFISRFYKGNKKETIINFLLSRQETDGKWENLFNTSFAVMALVNLGYDINKLTNSFEYIITEMNAEKFKNPYALYPDPAINGQQYYSFCSTVNTAFCLEALNKYCELKKDKTKIIINNKMTTFQKNGQKIYNTVIKSANKRCSLLGSELKRTALATLEKILAFDCDKQIILLPFYFQQAIKTNNKKIPPEIIIRLGLGNLYGWMAYTIYDDFLDDEGDPKLLSTANLFLRELTVIFHSYITKNTGFQFCFRRIMDKIDVANCWETTNCRLRKKNDDFIIPNSLPNYHDYSKLAERSFGHAIGPIALLFILSYTEKSSEIKNMELFFKNYFIARQLNDDMHDWSKDLKKGHLNSVCTIILDKWQKSKPNQNKKTINFEKELSQLEKIFWYEVANLTCDEIITKINLSKKILHETKIITNPQIILDLLSPTINVAQKTLNEREETLKFLKAYQ